MKLSGQFVNGRLSLDEAEEIIAAREYGDKQLVVDIEPEGSIRTVEANARYWTVLVPLARHHLNLKRTEGLLPLHKDQVHTLLVTAFLGSEETELGPVPMRTRNLTTRQFWHLTEETARWLRSNKYPVPEGRHETVAQAIAEAMA